MKEKIEGHRKDKLVHVKLSDVIVGTRARKDFGELKELIENIRQHGIIQPITLDTEYRLLAGGRRFAAAEALGLPTVPAVLREVEDDLDAMEIELIENTFRKDFDWVETAELTKRINDHYQKKHGVNWPQYKTSEQMGVSTATTSRNIQLAEAMEVIPELKLLKNPQEAFKLLSKMQEDAAIKELRKRQEGSIIAATTGITSDQRDGLKNLEAGIAATLTLAKKNYVIGDVFAGMKKMKDYSNIDFIECDPPYGIDLNAQKAGKDSITSTVTNYNEVASEVYETFLDKLCSELYRVAGRNCWMVFWFGPTWGSQVLAALKKAGWLVDAIPAIWTKAQGQTLQPDIHFARAWEPFYLCRKGAPVMIKRGQLNVFNYNGVPGASKYHPTQRPIELITEIMNRLIAGNAHVFVPFAGSGATLLACYNEGFRVTGYDIDDQYKDKFLLAAEEITRKLFAEETSGD